MWRARIDNFDLAGVNDAVCDFGYELYCASLNILDDVAYELFSREGFAGIVGVNDRLGHEKVMEVFDIAIAKAKLSEEQNAPKRNPDESQGTDSRSG